MQNSPRPHSRDRANHALDDLVWLTIGGLPQAFHLRAKDASAPLLLFLHGGPGLPHMPFEHVNQELANSFVVAQWDQRGAGKTFYASGIRNPLTLAQLVDDACEAVEQLCDLLGREDVILVGHSCGSAVGAFVAARSPRRIRMFIGVGQVTNLRAAELMRYEMVFRAAWERRDRVTLQKLTAIGQPPYTCPEDGDLLERIATELAGDCSDPFLDRRFTAFASGSALYTEGEFSAVGAGARYSQACLWNELVDELDLCRQALRFSMPIALIVGTRDVLAPAPLAADYFRALRAPRGKQFCQLDGLGHWPHLEAPRLYRAALSRVIATAAHA